MKIEKKEIANKLGKLKVLLNSKIIGNDGVVVKGNTLYATNIEMSIKTTLDIPASDENFVIPKSSIGLIENLPEGIIDITCKDKSVFIKCGKIKNKFPKYDLKNYPQRSDIKTKENTVINSEKLFGAINSVLYAVSETSDRKEVLKGVLLEAKDGILNVVGCDGFRMAWSKIECDGEFKLIIPKDIMRKIISIGMTGDIKITCDKSGVKFNNDEYEIYSRVITGEYLGYRQLFIDYPNQTFIERKNLSECLKRTLICGDDKSNNTIRCKFDKENVSVSLYQSISEYEEIVGLEKSVKESLEIGFNGRYLLDTINSFGSDKVSIGLGNNNQAIIMNDEKNSALLLPIRLSEKEKSAAA